jgi:hypothetical protein
MTDQSSEPALPVRHIHPTATAAFLLRCARSPDRWFYPANAKSRDPVCCAFQLHLADAAAVEVRVLECAYTEGGTGWRVWPCSLLLACWLAASSCELGISDQAALELGCGLGLPGLASAAFGAKRVSLSDCLPLLLRSVRSSIIASGVDERCCATLLVSQGPCVPILASSSSATMHMHMYNIHAHAHVHVHAHGAHAHVRTARMRPQCCAIPPGLGSRGAAGRGGRCQRRRVFDRTGSQP